MKFATADWIKTSVLFVASIILLVLAFLTVLLESVGYYPSYPFFITLYALLFLTFLVGMMGLILGLVRYYLTKTVYFTFIGFMLLCIMPFSAVQYIVDIRLRLLPINDVSTDITNPPTFYNNRDSRVVDTSDTRVVKNREIIHRLYAHPRQETMVLKVSCEKTSFLVASTLFYLGWPVYHAGSTGAKIESSASFFFTNFDSDFIVRMTRGDNDGCDVDLRSTSRHNFRDYGHNILLINRFVKALRLIESRLESSL